MEVEEGVDIGPKEQPVVQSIGVVALLARYMGGLEVRFEARSRDHAASSVGEQQGIAKGLSPPADHNSSRDELSVILIQV
jgi:hypothetical protein